MGMAWPASSGGDGLKAASQVVWRPARDMVVLVGLAPAGSCQSTGSQFGQALRVLLPGWTWLGRRPRLDELFRLWQLTWAKRAPQCPSFLS